MPSETVKFENGAQTYRIQFEVVAPPPAPPKVRGTYAPPLQFKVASIRVTELMANPAEEGQKKIINFARGFDTLAQARTGATEYAKRIVREQMTPKPVKPVKPAEPAA